MTLSVQDIARVAHTVNKRYCEAVGDHSQLDWEKAPSWQRSSAISGVELHLRDPDTTAEGSHKEWLRHKLSQGWVWGPNKDPDKKEHPCIVPYEKLPQEQKVKDHLFKAVIEALRPHARPDLAAQHFEKKINEQGEGKSNTGEDTVMAEQDETQNSEAPRQTENRPAAEQAQVEEYEKQKEAPGSNGQASDDEGDAPGAENASRDA
jgi:hypothetical protein